jgi:hypothetical protein
MSANDSDTDSFIYLRSDTQPPANESSLGSSTYNPPSPFVRPVMRVIRPTTQRYYQPLFVRVPISHNDESLRFDRPRMLVIKFDPNQTYNTVTWMAYNMLFTFQKASLASSFLSFYEVYPEGQLAKTRIKLEMFGVRMEFSTFINMYIGHDEADMVIGSRDILHKMIDLDYDNLKVFGLGSTDGALNASYTQQFPLTLPIRRATEDLTMDDV